MGVGFVKDPRAFLRSAVMLRWSNVSAGVMGPLGAWIVILFSSRKAATSASDAEDVATYDAGS